MARKDHPLLWLVKHTYSKWFMHHNRVTTTGMENIDFSTGPFLILVNHSGLYDPLMITSVLPRNVRWVTGAYLLKIKIINYFFSKIVNSIAKQQGQSDFSTIKEMLKALRNNQIVGIFPEGTRTWDGDMMPYNKRAMAKMIQLFDVPVVYVNLEGCYARQPRWSKSYRKGQGINVNFRYFLPADKIKTMTTEQIENSLTDHFDFSNDVWKENNPYEFKSKVRAEGLERLFYMCPECNAVGKIKTKGCTVECSACHTKYNVTEKDDIVSEKDGVIRHFSQWHDWEATQIGTFKSLEQEKAILFQVGTNDNNAKLKTISRHLTIFADDYKFYIECRNQEKYCLDFNDISSFVLNARQTMELVAGDKVYRIRLLPNSSSLKFQDYYQAYKKRMETEK